MYVNVKFLCFLNSGGLFSFTSCRCIHSIDGAVLRLVRRKQMVIYPVAEFLHLFRNQMHCPSSEGYSLFVYENGRRNS
ncbi:hypothetical protein CEXT_778381 [Caerostris extrusa]|uniref:Secreted protein n=1 Tax=Caerostris extrusa TaxID=172846 RepID=A0AAV4VTZ6_CAEEX|nr:hypothetical protein CEXT_778381 [Caerostris extrusa]